MFALLDAREQEPDATGAVELAAPRGEVTFEHVDFSYVPDRKLLQDICIEAKPGMRFALVGPTGCGKTTLINLLLRFYDIDAGRIMVDARSSRDYTRASLRRAFGMVLQDTWLFEGTVAENIAYGCPDATREQVIEAAKRAHAHKFIVQLPGGYDTVIGDQTTLSGKSPKSMRLQGFSRRPFCGEALQTVFFIFRAQAARLCPPRSAALRRRAGSLSYIYTPWRTPLLYTRGRS